MSNLRSGNEIVKPLSRFGYDRSTRRHATIAEHTTAAGSRPYLVRIAIHSGRLPVLRYRGVPYVLHRAAGPGGRR